MFENVFVYGTLKRNFRNNHIMDKIQAEYICDVETDYTFPLYDSYYGFPFLQKYTSGLGYKIKGEIWSVPSDRIKELDYFEGVPELYSPIYIDCYDDERRLFASIKTYMRSDPLTSEELKDIKLISEWIED